MIKRLAFVLGAVAALAFTSTPAAAQRHHGGHSRSHGHGGISISVGVPGYYGYGGRSRYRDPYYYDRGYYDRGYYGRGGYYDDYYEGRRHHRRHHRRHRHHSHHSHY